MSDLTGRVIGAAMTVHGQLGPGLLESTYEECLAYELGWNGISYQRQVPLPLEYRGHRLDCGYQMDLVVEGQLILELKAVSELLPIHQAQVLTYLRLSGLPLALFVEFQHGAAETRPAPFRAQRPRLSACSAPLR